MLDVAVSCVAAFVIVDPYTLQLSFCNEFLDDGSVGLCPLASMILLVDDRAPVTPDFVPGFVALDLARQQLANLTKRLLGGNVDLDRAVGQILLDCATSTAEASLLLGGRLHNGNLVDQGQQGSDQPDVTTRFHSGGDELFL